MAGGHHRLDGREFEWTPRVGDGQGGLACCDSWDRKKSDMTEQLNWTEKAGFVNWTRFCQWMNFFWIFANDWTLQSRVTLRSYSGSLNPRFLIGKRKVKNIYHIQFSSVAQSFLTLCNPMNCGTLGLPVHHQLSEFTQTHVHRVSDAIQPSHPLLSPFPPVPKSLPASQSFPMSQLFTQSWSSI